MYIYVYSTKWNVVERTEKERERNARVSQMSHPPSLGEIIQNQLLFEGFGIMKSSGDIIKNGRF